MAEYLLRRLLLALPTLLGLSVILFILLRLLPGDAALLKVMGGEDVLNDPAALDAVRRQMGLDKPLPVQYLEWLAGILSGNLGNSLWTHEPALKELVDRLPVTLELAVGAAVFSALLGLAIGIVAAVNQDRPTDYVSRLFGVLGTSVPSFWTGTLLIVMPALLWGYLPPLGHVSFVDDPLTNLRQFVAPWIALGWALSASVMRMTRSQMLEVLRNDYIRTARAKGLHERVVVYRHALRNALIPVITITGVQLGFLLGGTVVVEAVYGLPGVGTATLQAITRRDYPVIQTNILFIAFCYVIINLVVDLAYGWLDPRIRYSSAKG